MYAHENPFASHRMDRLEFRFVNGDWDTVFGQLEVHGNRGTVVGPHGHGKTTFIDALEKRLRMRGWNTVRIHLTESQRRLPALESFGRSDFVMLDGAERLGRLGLWRFVRATRLSGGVVVTMHASGRWPTLCHCQTNLALMRALLDELWPDAPRHIQSAAVRLYHQHRGNIRLVFRGLYDLCAAYPDISSVRCDAWSTHELRTG